MNKLLTKILEKTTINCFLSLGLVSLLGCYTPNYRVVKMQVEVDVFSGRPNPHWDLTPQESHEFIKLFQALPQNKGEGYVKEGLGYRGLILKEITKSIESYNEIVISNGVVVTKQDSQSQRFTDKNRSLERWLFQTGKGRMDDDLYRQIGAAAQLN